MKRRFWIAIILLSLVAILVIIQLMRGHGVSDHFSSSDSVAARAATEVAIYQLSAAELMVESDRQGDDATSLGSMSKATPASIGDDVNLRPELRDALASLRAALPAEFDIEFSDQWTSLRDDLLLLLSDSMGAAEVCAWIRSASASELANIIELLTENMSGGGRSILFLDMVPGADAVRQVLSDLIESGGAEQAAICALYFSRERGRPSPDALKCAERALATYISSTSDVLEHVHSRHYPLRMKVLKSIMEIVSKLSIVHQSDQEFLNRSSILIVLGPLASSGHGQESAEVIRQLGAIGDPVSDSLIVAALQSDDDEIVGAALLATRGRFPPTWPPRDDLPPADRFGEDAHAAVLSILLHHRMMSKDITLRAIRVAVALPNADQAILLLDALSERPECQSLVVPLRIARTRIAAGEDRGSIDSELLREIYSGNLLR